MDGPRRISAWLAAHPVVSVLVLAVLTAALAWQARGIETHFEVEDFFPEDTLERRVYEDHRASFGRDDRAALVILESDDPMGIDEMRIIAALAKRLEARDDIEEVLAPTSSLIAVRSANGVVELVPALPDEALSVGSEARMELARRRLSERPYVNQVLSRDGRVAIVAAIIDPDHLDNRSRHVVTRALEKERDALLADGRWTVRLAGYPIHRVYLTEHVNHESKKLTPVVLLVIALILLAVFRSLTGLLLPLAVAGLSVVWCLGLMSLFSIPTNILSPALFILVALVSVTDTIHFTSAWVELQREEAARASFVVSLQAV